MKQNNKNLRQDSAKYGNLYVQQQQFNSYAGNNSNSNIYVPTTSYNRFGNNKEDLHQNIKQKTENATIQINTTDNSIQKTKKTYNRRY